jgi:hypothetical protein
MIKKRREVTDGNKRMTLIADEMLTDDQLVMLMKMSLVHEKKMKQMRSKDARIDYMIEIALAAEVVYLIYTEDDCLSFDRIKGTTEWKHRTTAFMPPTAAAPLATLSEVLN